VVLADSQDNPGGGGSGDTTGLLQALITAGAAGAVFGVLADPESVRQAREAGVGGLFAAALGGKSGLPGQSPYECSCRVLSLPDGNFTATGPMYHGAHMVLGPCALLETSGIRVLVSSQPVQVADQSIFRHFAIEPADEDILALKSSVHFRNDFTDLASAILVIAAPGAVVADPAMLDYRRKRPGIRLLSR
jgi:microcystin degradation protein MlrC